jgi:hypothetical protein
MSTKAKGVPALSQVRQRGFFIFWWVLGRILALIKRKYAKNLKKA